MRNGSASRDDGDDDLFLQEVADVTRMPAHDPPPKPTPEPLPPRDDDAAVMRELDALAQGEIPFEIADTGEYMEGLAQGIDRRHLSKLKRGEYSFRRHIDLHGLTRVQARDEVNTFVENARRDGIRCVLIVHGRGIRSPAGPILKEAIKSWLARGRLGRVVMAFASARPTDGGSGAVYVLLRR